MSDDYSLCRERCKDNPAAEALCQTYGICLAERAWHKAEPDTDGLRSCLECGEPWPCSRSELS